jgi:hypothetical protein
MRWQLSRREQLSQRGRQNKKKRQMSSQMKKKMKRQSSSELQIFMPYRIP